MARQSDQMLHQMLRLQNTMKMQLTRWRRQSWLLYTIVSCWRMIKSDISSALQVIPPGAKFRRLANMENAPHHLEPVFLIDLLEPLYTNHLASFELLSECLPGVTQNVLESINSILWQKVPKHKFHGTKRVHIGACSTVIYYNQGATGKFSVLILMSLPLFHNALEVARAKDQHWLKRLKQISQKVVEERKKWKIEEAVENEKRLHKGGAAYSAGKFLILTLEYLQVYNVVTSSAISSSYLELNFLNLLLTLSKTMF